MTEGGSRTSVLVIGVGGIGGYLGGKLCQAGEADVTFAAQGRVLKALQRNGLSVKGGDGDFAVPDVRAATLAEIDARFDYVLVCVRRRELDAVLERLQDLVSERTLVIPLLDGFGADEVVATTVGSSRAIGAVVHLNAYAEGPGVIAYTPGGRLVIGPLAIPQETAGGQPAAGPDGDPRLRDFAGLCERAGIRSDVSRDIASEQWRALIWSAAFGAVTALSRCTVAQAVANRDGEAVVRAAMIEALMVGQSYGISLNPSDIETYLSQARTIDSRTQMEVDVEAGERTETDAINGVVVRKARGIGIPTPVNQTLLSLLKVIDAHAAQGGAK